MMKCLYFLTERKKIKGNYKKRSFGELALA